MHIPHSMNTEKGTTLLIRLDAVNTTASKISIETLLGKSFRKSRLISLHVEVKILPSALEDIIYEFLFFFFFFKWLNFVDASDRAAEYKFSATIQSCW